MSDWRPIETAPKDGTRIRARYGEYVETISWRSGPKVVNGHRFIDQPVWFWTDGKMRCREPDGWQPLPEPPESK